MVADTDTEIAEIYQTIIQRTAIGYSGLAPLVPCSPATLRHFLAVGRLPERSGPRLAIIRFARANRDVRTRADLRVV